MTLARRVCNLFRIPVTTSEHFRLILISQNVGRNDGQGRVNYEIVRGALAAGWSVTVIAVGCDSDLLGHDRFQFVRIQVQKLPTQLLRNYAFAILSALWVRANRQENDILQVNGCVTLGRADINAAHFVHGAWLRDAFYPFQGWRQGPYAAYQRIYSEINAKHEIGSFLRSRRIVAVSEKVEAELVSIGVPEQRITVIHNGVDTDEFRPGPPERHTFGLPTNGCIFLFAGDLRTPRKNLDTVLAALFNLPDLHLAVAGPTSGSPFPKLSERLGLANRVHFLGGVTRMAALMRSVDALVFPSRYECMSLVLLEALASGLPILTAVTAGGAEIIGSAGRVLQNPDDSETLSKWMRELAFDSAMRQSMGEVGRKIALSHTWLRMAERYTKLHSEVKTATREEALGGALSHTR